MVPFVRIWISLSTTAVLAGWTLSLFGKLDRPGYLVFFLAVLILLWPLRKQFEFCIPKFSTQKILRRIRHPLPLCFIAFVILIFVGGIIYPPSNYTGLQYRLARILQWLAHGGWFWIHSPNYRMNDRACGFEWMAAPILLFTKSDRALFLVNFIPFLLMPGLIFSVFTRLGVQPRVAWKWMWLLPTGYDFLLQAGSIANDTFPAVFALAAIDFALRAKKSNHISDLYFSILAAALMTGAKASNLPLLLPWVIAGTTKMENGSLKLDLSGVRAVFRLPSSILVICAAAAASFLPNAILNYHFCGDWSGAVLEEPRLAQKNPVAGIYGNFFQFTLDNFAPPVFPMAHWWNEHAPQIMPHFLTTAADKYFDSGFFALGELPTEDWAGIGFGLSILLLSSVAANLLIRKSKFVSPFPSLAIPVFAGAWIALLAFCAKSGLTNAARIIAPYYPLLVASLIVGKTPSKLVRSTWWNWLAATSVVLAFVVLIVSPDRPLWPAKTILSKLSEQHPDSASISRALKVYTTYAQRSDPLANVRQLLPEKINEVGFIAGPDDMDISFWKPYGTRRVEHFFLNDTAAEIRELHPEESIRYFIIGGYNLKSHQMTIDDWLQSHDAELVASTNATLKVSEGPQPWYIVRLNKK